MKCALPGRYGKKILIESSAILDSYYDNHVDGEKNLAEDISLSFDEAVYEHEKNIKDIFDRMLKRYEIHEKEKKVNNDSFEKLKMEILQKDKEEYSQK